MHHKTNTDRTWAGNHWGTGHPTGSCTVTAGIWERETGHLTALAVCREPQGKERCAWKSGLGPGRGCWGGGEVPTYSVGNKTSQLSCHSPLRTSIKPPEMARRLTAEAV